MGKKKDLAVKKPKSRISELIDFLFHPDMNISTNQSLKESLKDVLYYFVLSVLLVSIIGLVIFTVFSVQNSVISDLSAGKPLFRTFLIACLLLPVLEEAIFRLPLKYKPLNLAISIAVLYWGTVSYLILTHVNKDFGLHQMLCLLSAILIGLLIFYIARKNSENLSKFWANNFKLIFYSSIVLFGLFHVQNLEIPAENIYYIPIIIVPWLIGGHITGFIRIKYGFFFGVVYHGLYNLFPVLLASTN